MYNKTEYGKTSLEINESSEGETLENKLERIVNNGEGIEDGAPSIYTERSMGVLAEYDIRTDKWDLALDAMDKAHNTDLGKRMSSIEDRKEALKALKEVKKESEGGEPTSVVAQ